MAVTLTDEQKQAVLTIEGAVCCIASAGSGKTSAFTTRLAYMIKKNISPSSIMAITFTKKASEEMMKRLKAMVGKDKANKVAIGTTHSIILKILMRDDENFKKYSIIPEWHKFTIMRDLCEKQTSSNPYGLNLSIKAGQLASFISYQKSNLIKPNDDFIFDEITNFVSPHEEADLRNAYIRYEKLKSNSRQIDFDDMLMYMHQKLSLDEGFRAKLNKEFRYIMIDEFQDSSIIVSEIVKMINDKNVFVVGDFRQSIYSFMNAKVQNILEFHKNFNDVTTIQLNKNFRSTQRIVDFSNDIIEKSPMASYKDFLPSESIAEEGSPVKFTAYQDSYVQVANICDEIKQKLEEGAKPSDIAILVRTNSQTGTIEDKLTTLEVEYELSKTSSFFDKKEIVDMLSYLKLATDFNDNEAFRRIYNTPNRYLSKRSLELLESEATKSDESLWVVSGHSDLNSDWKFKRNIEGLKSIIFQANEMLIEGNKLDKVMKYLMEATSYAKYIKDTSSSFASQIEREESLKRLIELSKRFKNATDFLTKIKIIRDSQKKSKGGDTVKISTIHSAKGLEWDTVYVIDAINGLIPHEMSGDVEEERRLFYVACSRPRKELNISWGMFKGEEEEKEDAKEIEPSIFIEELVGKELLGTMKGKIFNSPSTSIHYKI